MTPRDVIAKLARMFPQGFGEKGGYSDWAPVYMSSLEPFSGSILEQAFTRTMSGWDRPFPPMPGALQVACVQARKEITTGADGGINMKRVSEELQRLRPILVEDWLRGNADLVAEFLARLSDEDPAPPPPRSVDEWDGKIHTPSDRQYARSKLVNLIHDRAHATAMRQAMAMPGQVDVTGDDLDRIDRQVRSQLHSAAGHHRRPNLFTKVIRPLRDGPEPAREMTEEDWERIEADPDWERIEADHD